METFNRHAVITALGEPSVPRLRLRDSSSPYGMLDGGWWPRSADPVAELPGLILALDHVHGPVLRVVLHRGDWTRFPLRLGVAGRIVRLAYFDSHPSGLLTAFSSTFVSGRTDLLVVPAATPQDVATAALGLAADRGNHLRAQHILTSLDQGREQAEASGAEDDWESEGGGRPAGRADLARAGVSR